MNRVFVHSSPRLDYRGWLAALKAGRSFASNGPLLGFTLNGHEAGDEIALPAGVHRLTARVSLRSMVPVEKLEIVANGVVTRSGWFTLRAWSSKADPAVLDIYPFATTSPVYVSIAGRPVRSAEDARWFVKWIERLEAGAAAHTGWNSEAEKKIVLDHLAAAKAVFLRRAEEAAR